MIFFPYSSTSSTWPITIGAIIAFCVVILSVALIAGPSKKDKEYWAREEARYEAGLLRWLAECEEPKGRCIQQWDASVTLRDLYYKRSAR